MQRLEATATISTVSNINLGPQKQSLPPNKAPVARFRKDCKLPVYKLNQESDQYEEVLMDFEFPYRDQVSLAT